MSLTPNPALVRSVLQQSARGQIVPVNGMVRHRSDLSPPEVLSLLQTLHRHGAVGDLATSGPRA